eukprot:m.202538 g.202538  ORF g.202538 m.202538 type:complete len:506 (+) comp21796_c0_seq1:506-2023(+)
MGAYLSKPVTKKISADYEDKGLKIGVTEMQGWRVSMEDASVVDLEFAENMVLLGVLDGHGGAEVAKFVASHFPNVLRRQAAFQQALQATASDAPALLEAAFTSAFVEMDVMIAHPDHREELEALAGNGLADSDEDEESGSGGNGATNDASIPIETLFAEYLRNQQAACNGCDDDGEGGAAAGDDANGTTAAATSLLAALLNGDRIEVAGPAADEAGAGSAARPNHGAAVEGGDEHVETTGNGEANTSADGDDDDDDEWTDDETESDNGELMRATLEDEEGARKRAGSGGSASAGPTKRTRHAVEECPGITSGTTANLALVCTYGDTRILVVANVGDSRAVICRNGVAVDLSDDHHTEHDAERERVEAAGGRIAQGRVNGGLNMTRALGDHQFKQNKDLPLTAQMISPEPDVTITTLGPEDKFLVLACDGIWNSLTSEDVIDFVASRVLEGGAHVEGPATGGAPMRVSATCETLCDACMSETLSGDGTGLDNETAMVVMFNAIDST